MSARGDPKRSGVHRNGAAPDFEYDMTQDVSIKYLIVGGQRIASLYFPDPFGAFSWPGWLRPWLPLAGQIVLALAIGLALLGIVGIVVQGSGVRPPAWLSAPGVGVLAFGLLTLTLPVRAAGSVPQGTHERLLAHITDHQGSVRGAVNLLGIVVEERDYTPFGMSVNYSGTFDLPHRFTGQAEDDAAGFYDYGARMFDPRWGRFLSPDSFVQSFDSQGLNRYAYVSNAPTSLVDPTGNVGGCFAVVLVTSCFGGGLTSFSPSARIRAGINAAVARLLAALLAGLDLGDGGRDGRGSTGGSAGGGSQEDHKPRIGPVSPTFADFLKNVRDFGLAEGFFETREQAQAASEFECGDDPLGCVQIGVVEPLGRGKLVKLGQKAITTGGRAGSKLLQRLAQRAGLSLESGGKHLTVRNPVTGKVVTQIPHTVKGKGTARDIVNKILNQLE